MPIKYRFMYKCRLCGEVYEDGNTDSHELADKAVYMAIFCKSVDISGETLHRHGTHECKDGSIGFSEFVGAKRG